jgi:hypothetical protein
VSLDPARRAGLERARGLAIVRDHFHLDIKAASVDVAPFGVTVRVGDPTAATAVIVSSVDDLSVLGGALVWLDRNPMATVHLVVEHHSGIHARRAAVLSPELVVHQLVGSEVRPAEPALVEDPHPVPDDSAPLVAMIERSGAEMVVEDGIVRAEVAGLEVGRVVTGPTGSTFEVGVGRFDREAGALLHGGRPVEPALVDTIEMVRAHRVVGAVAHPVNRIGRERWLRDMVRRDPAIAGVSDPVLVEPIPPRTSLLRPAAAALLAFSGERRTLVVCAVGVELSLVPDTADLLLVHRPDEVRFVLPARDRLPFLDRLSARLPVPVSFADIAVPWVD